MARVSTSQGLEVSAVAARRSATALAAEAVALAPVDPHAARDLAASVLASARPHDASVRSVAERALGMAAREENDLAGAVSHLRRSVRVAERGGLSLEAAQSRVQLAPTLALRGAGRLALGELDLAAAVLAGEDLARLNLQRGNVLLIGGDLGAALEAYGEALPGLRAAGDRPAEASLLNNRGMVLSNQGTPTSMAASERDLRRAELLFGTVADEPAQASVRQNLGFVAARRGDLPAALSWFDRADEQLGRLGQVDPVGLRDRCEALLPARLLLEAREAAEEAVRLLAEQGRHAYLAEARLVLARTAVLQGDLDDARREAGMAARSFSAQGRLRWRQLARQIELQAAWRAGERSNALLQRARRLAASLEATGWSAAALGTRLIATDIAVDLGRLAVARRELAPIGRISRAWPVELRVAAYHVQARVRLAAGDRKGAQRMLRAGMRTVEANRAVLGASELRALVSGHGDDLAALGLRLALEGGRAEAVLRWTERGRAASLALPLVAPEDEGLVAELGQLRAVSVQVQEAILEGRDSRQLQIQQVALERAISRRSRRRSGSGTGSSRTSSVATPTLAELRRFLGDEALVELTDVDGWVSATVVTRDGARVHRLGDTAAIAKALDALRFSLRLLTRQRLSGRPTSAAASADEACGRLDDCLLRSLRSELDGRGLVIVPPPSLLSLPWSALASGRGRTVVVAPSATLWLRAKRSPAQTRRGATLVAGPRLQHARAEIAAIRGCYPDAASLTGDDATVQAVLDALTRTPVAHLAAHGRFRADNPLFSSIELADGPVTVHDLERLARAPETLILSSCESGMVAATGGELMGTLAALFALGTRTVIAAVVPVLDEETVAVMVALHRRLNAGQTPAEALAGTLGDLRPDDPATWTAASFVCFGAA